VSVPIRWHTEDPVLLREAIGFTAAETGFTPRLIEKDYFCSVLLEHFSVCSDALTFKGGTCLSKIHVGFYRLSEDLDFSISTPVGAPRSSRSRSAAPIKAAVAEIATRLPGFRVERALTGANGSTQYRALVSYGSLVNPQPETISIEVGVREPHMMEPVTGASKTAVLNPIDGQALVDTHPVRCLSYTEAMAEKLRAALCRPDVAIRDFCDIDYAVRNVKLNTRDPALLNLLRRKLQVPGTGPVDVSQDRMGQLRRQLEAQLRPVLREQEFAQFDLERATEIVREVAEAVGRTQ
jgi:predicted nucleotidyltransferase component of viral defense system